MRKDRARGFPRIAVAAKARTPWYRGAGSPARDASRRGSLRSRSLRERRGFTLIEIMVVLAIVSLFLTGVIVSARSLAKTDLRSTSSQMASGIRYLFDRARSTGKYYRLVIDLDAGRYWAEV